MERLFHDIPLQDVSTSMTINSTASTLLAYYALVAQRQGADRRKLQGTIQNDILKEYIARGTYIYPTRQAMRIITDIFAWAGRGCQVEYDFDQRLSHAKPAPLPPELRSPSQCHRHSGRRSRRAGGGSFAPRLSFFFNSHESDFSRNRKFRARISMRTDARR